MMQLRKLQGQSCEFIQLFIFNNLREVVKA